MRCALVAFAAVVAAPAVASAGPRVVVIETPDLALPSLGTRITLHGDAVEVRTVREADLHDVAARAPEMLAAHDATLVVWVERNEPAGPLVVYVAGAWTDRALIELVRIDGTMTASEIERLVSLKIVALLDTVLAPRPTATTLGARPLGGRDPWRLALGFATALGTDDRAFAMGPALVVERRWHGEWSLSVVGGMRMMLAGSVDSITATTSIGEYSLATGVELTRGPLLATVAVMGTMFRANASTLDGRRGAATELVPVGQAGVGLRVPLASAELVLGAQLEHSLIRQRFLVDGMAVADLGRERGVVRAAISLPLR